jgi:hypothetical protein
MVDPARRGDDPLAAGAALDRPSDQGVAVRRGTMTLKVFAVTVVEPGEVDLLGRGQPSAGLVIDEDAADAVRRFAGRQIGLELCDGVGAHSVEFQPMDKANQDRVDELERVVRMLDQRLGEIGHVHFGSPELGIARFPFAPATQGQDGDANQRDESCRPNGVLPSSPRPVAIRFAPIRRKPLTFALTASCAFRADCAESVLDRKGSSTCRTIIVRRC